MLSFKGPDKWKADGMVRDRAEQPKIPGRLSGLHRSCQNQDGKVVGMMAVLSDVTKTEGAGEAEGVYFQCDP